MNELMKDYDYNNLNIVYEDNHILVVIKPQGIPTQADKSEDIDMLTLLKRYIKDKYHKEGNVYLGLVHRLDRPTGGIMVFAKTSKAAERLSESIRSGDFEKRYITVVHGKLENTHGRLENYLFKYESLNMVKVVPPTTKDAKKAVLEYNLLDSKDDTSLVWVKLETGRSHQIRVQMEYIGHPLVGDVKYGPTKSKLPYPLALWACELRFTHPTTKERLVFRVYPDKEQYPFNKYDIDMLLKLNVKNN